ncbi:helix-turn-helix domain-containing protein [Pinibacter soli]|uniref:Helix-turn-helix domain-containing protein n=1 Tax=Pinibacter soli TaxID=3044211 RepID=A0ABT6RA44_9BACT|nr:helix-turn-helix domain-containing protein [Pinibacter soli]MDI3319447.1 helix-turn-helix domain-containing protein [Pinibacter soli]
MKEDINTSHIPFILLTAKDAFQSKLDGLSGGADHYFSKPVSIELLQLTIKNIFAQRQIIKDRFSHDYKVEVKELVHSTKDKEFMDNLLQMVKEQMENTDLNVDFICQKIGMSKTKLYKKLKDITGQTINEFVRSFRLKQAVEIMVHEDVSITEVMFRVGIQSNSYFTTIFKKEYNKTPSQPFGWIM